MSSRILFVALCVALASCADSKTETKKSGPECDDNSVCADDEDDDTTADDDDSEQDTSNARTDASKPGKDASVDARTEQTKRDASDTSTRDASKAEPDATAPANDASTPVDNGEAKPSTGCGMAAPMAGNQTIDVGGTSRAYILELPANYDPKRPYRLIFAWHGLGGTAAQIARTWYGLKARADNSAIFVAGQGLQTSNSVGSGPGWPNTNGQDVNFVKALYARLQGQLCFDENRVFSTGMSYGGIMSNTLGCQMGEVFRAIAPMSGSGPGYGGRATCVGQVAVWSSHGDNDTVVSTASGEASRDFWVKANHCQTTSKPVDPSPCVAYDGCDADAPVTFCKFTGGHTVPAFAAGAIWTFFSQF